MTVRRVMPVFTVSDVEETRDAYVQVLGLREVMNL
jgi:catechol 2,3-dioxygenase-like lactoylglutathione lyase family enzyme